MISDGRAIVTVTRALDGDLKTLSDEEISNTPKDWSKLPEVKVSKSELQAHQEFIDFIDEKNSEPSIWSSLAIPTNCLLSL